MTLTTLKRLSMLAIAGISLLTSGCATDQQTDTKSKPKRKYVYLPVTGSHLGRRVLVNEDGTLADSPGEPVQAVNPSALSEVQRKGSVNPGRGN